MGEYVSAQIAIGGSIRPRVVPGLCKAIRSEQLGQEWAVTCFDPKTAEDLLSARQDSNGQNILRLCDDEANYGAFRQLEAFLVRHKIPFDRYTDGNYSWSPHCVIYSPETGSQQWETTADGLMLGETTWQIREAILAMPVTPGQENLNLLRESLQQLARGMPPHPIPLPDFEIDSPNE